MIRFILKKFLQIFPVILASTLVIFIMVKISGLNPVMATLGSSGLSEDALQEKMARYGLDQPVWLQYIYWLKNIMTGNWGESVNYKVPVSELMSSGAPITASLTIPTFIISETLAVLLGIAAAVRRNTVIDKIITSLTLFLFAIPTFFLGMLVILFASKYMPWYSYTGGWNSASQYILRLSVPAIVMCAHQIALVTKLTRSSMIDQLNSDYVLALRAKGLSNGKIIFKHALKNGIIPVITVSGIQFGALIVGSVLVENVFSLQGLGKIMVQSVSVGDIAVIQGIAFIIIIIFLAANFLVDILYAMIDPRVRRNENVKNPQNA